MNQAPSLPERDNQVIWHPFTQHALAAAALPVQSAQGAWLTLASGEKILDAISAWWANLHGHAHPVLAEAIFAQAKQLEHIAFAQFTHEPAVQLAEILVQAAQRSGAELARCFYSDNGSTAVEAALKMAYQYYRNQGMTTRTRFLALKNSYHGDTLGCMAVSDRESFHQYFNALLPAVDFIAPDDITAVAALRQQGTDCYAAVIVEPLIQGAGGMRLHSVEFLQQLEQFCRATDTLFICDEVFTGFYRTGTCFAFEQAGIKPDLLCLSKGLTSGCLPLAVTLTTEKIFQNFYAPDMAKAFLHGHTFSANPIACAAALASWALLQRPATQQAIQRITLQTRDWIAKLSQLPRVQQARALGVIGALEIAGVPGYFAGLNDKIAASARKHGVLLRPLGATLYAVPPYCVTDEEIALIYETMATVIADLEI